jgi:hypothetical protein
VPADRSSDAPEHVDYLTLPLAARALPVDSAAFTATSGPGRTLADQALAAALARRQSQGRPAARKE